MQADLSHMHLVYSNRHYISYNSFLYHKSGKFILHDAFLSEIYEHATVYYAHSDIRNEANFYRVVRNKKDP